MGNFIDYKHSSIQYTGRIDFSKDNGAVLIYAGSYIKIKFKGSSLKVVLTNLHNKDWGEGSVDTFGYCLDNQIINKVSISKSKESKIYTIAENLEDKEHEIFIYKTQDSVNYIKFEGIVLDDIGEIKDLSPKSNKRIEFYGDSVTSGCCCEAHNYVGIEDPDHNGEYCNAWYSYSLITARMLNAQIHNISQGGIALLSSTGYFRQPNTIGMENVYNKLGYVPEIYVSEWDFSNYIPQVVVIAIGQNDSYPDANMLRDEEKKNIWKNKYKEMLFDLMNKYNKSIFILKTTILNHDKIWDDTLEEIVKEINDKRVKKFTYKRNGAATKGHPRIVEHYEMANELTEYIKKLGEEIWY